MAFDIDWYFAFVEPGEAFDPEVHNRRDVDFLGFTYGHEEGQFAVLRLITRNPLGLDGAYALGLLGPPPRKKWGLFSWDKGNGPELLLRGRLIGLPSEVFGAKVTIDFQARPTDYKAQKEALADAMRVRPWWCQEFYDEQQRSDPELVLESRSVLWYTDPASLVVSTSDILLGEGGTEIFTQAEHRFDGYNSSIASVAALSLAVVMDLNWTQRAVGNIDLSFSTSSYTLDAAAYPSAGASFGDGWSISSATITEPFTFETRTIQRSSEVTVNWSDGEKSSLKTDYSDDVIDSGADAGISLSSIITGYAIRSTYSEEGDLTSWSHSSTWVTGLIPLHDVVANYVVGYDAARTFTERVRFTLRADVQPTAAELDDDDPIPLELKSIDLSELVDGSPVIEDPRRRSYIAYQRGREALQYGILVGRARLRKASRVADISFAPYVDRLGDLKLNKNATVHDWRLPGGVATGKIRKFTATLSPPTDKSGASFSLEVVIGCATGNGGVLAGAAGNPTYAETDYCGNDYQEFEGTVLVFNDDIGFTVPQFDPNDDGLDFISGVTASTVFETPVAAINEAGVQAAAIAAELPNSPAGPTLGLPPPFGFTDWAAAMQAAVTDRETQVKNILDRNATQLSFKLKDLRSEFVNEIELEVEDVKIPTMIDLEAE